MKKVLEGFTKELVLLSKGWYNSKDRTTDFVIGARAMVATVAGVKELAEEVNTHKVLTFVLFEVCDVNHIERLVRDMFEWNRNELTVQEVIQKMMGQLSILKCSDLDIGEIDIKIQEEFNKRIKEYYKR